MHQNIWCTFVIGLALIASMGGSNPAFAHSDTIQFVADVSSRKINNVQLEVSILSTVDKGSNMKAYVHTGSTEDSPPKIIKPSETIGAILGTSEPSAENYILMLELRVKNLGKEEARFSLSDMAVRWPTGSAKPYIFATGAESTTPAQVPIAKMDKPSSFEFPIITKDNVEFSVPSYAESIFRFYFSIPRNEIYFSLEFRGLKPVKVSMPEKADNPKIISPDATRWASATFLDQCFQLALGVEVEGENL
jgi:hypothetical protein